MSEVCVVSVEFFTVSLKVVDSVRKVLEWGKKMFVIHETFMRC